MAESISPLPPSNRNTERDTNQESEIDDRDIFDTPREEIDVENNIVRDARDEQTHRNVTSHSGTSQINGNDISRSRNSQINDNDTSRSRNSQINENDTIRSRNSQIKGNDISRSRNSQINENDTSPSRNPQINENETSQSRTSQIKENNTSRSRNSQIKENDTSRSRTSQSNGNDTSRSRTSQINENDTSRSKNSLMNENDTSPSRISPTKPRRIESETKYTGGENDSHPNNSENSNKDGKNSVNSKKETKRNNYSNGDNTTRSNQNNKKDETVKSQDGEDKNEITNIKKVEKEITNTKKVEKENESVSNDGNINNDSKQPTFPEIQKANDDSLNSPSREPITNNNVTSSASEKHSDSDRYTDSETTGGKSSLSEHTPRSQTKKSKKNPKRSSKSPKPTKSKSILKTEESKPHKPLAFMASLLEDGTTPRNPTRDSGDSTVVSLPAINRQNVINKVYVDDTEKIVNKYPKRDKDFKLEFVYDLRPKYPSWYAPEKRLSRREEKVFSDMSGVYADYKQQDERHLSKTKTMDDRLKKLEKLKREEIREKKRKKLATAYEQYEQLKDVREKFDIMCWYRNHTQYITPRVLEHEKLSRHIYGLPESLKEQQQLIKNLKRKPKKRTKNGNRIDSH
ncbi:putative uncharacterized protein DDB_G0282133 [Mytilus trossulus]|uniref:putative uncharacterized protein DDB_G0282133 n=1 Tax=Mytilus trossulus TaxID=6551 RepID=UPI003007D9A8